MRAAFHTAQGSPDVLRVGELPEPACGPGDVLVAVEAAGLDRVDVFFRAGTNGMRITGSHVGGRDVAGRIVAVGESVPARYPQLVPGLAVVGMSRVGGAHAELAATPAVWTLPLPVGCTFAEAAALPTAGRSAYDALVNRAAVRPGEDVLVTAGGSGVGSYGIQIARTAGCRVFTTVGRPAKVRPALELGAAAVIDHHREAIADRVLELTGGEGVHAVLDHVGAPVFRDALRSLRPYGRFVTTGVTGGHRADLHLGRVFERGLSILGVGRPDAPHVRAALTGLYRLVAAGAVRPQVHAVLPLEDIAEAHRMLERSDFFGKVVLQVGAGAV